MDLNDLSQQIQNMQQRFALLQQWSDFSPPGQQPMELVAAAFQEIGTALEELQVVNEELQSSFEALCAQNQQLLVAQQELVTERQCYQELFEEAPDAYLVTDMNGAIAKANSAAATLLNRKPQSIVGVPLAVYIIEQEQQTFLSQLSKLAQIGGMREWEVSLQPPNRMPVTTLMRVAVVRDQEGTPVGYRLIVRDITEDKRVHKALADYHQTLEEQVQKRTCELEQETARAQRAEAAAQAANVAKSTFIASMSHELRTPLNAILGFSQLLTRDASLAPMHHSQLEIINRSGEHLLTLINNVLSIAKIEAGQATLNLDSFDLHELLESVAQMLQLKANAKGISLILDVAADIPQYIQTDSSKLRQTLINLFGNAIKFTEQGGVTLRVKASEAQGSRGAGESEKTNSPLPLYSCAPVRLFFEVEDTGLGIAAQEISTLFDPFVQTQTGRQSMVGTGLGLTISRQFVRLMGGDITVSSTPNQGSIFIFDIKVNEARVMTAETKSPQQRVIGLEPNQPTYRILVVEDTIDNRQLFVKLLASLGFEVREAVNGQEAIAVWQSWQPHLILMDIQMPVMNGYEATKVIKRFFVEDASRSSLPQAPVIIALSASAFEEQREAILSVGCDDLLCKPFREENLLAKMALHLGIHYIYEQNLPPSPSRSLLPSNLTAEQLKVMPYEWVEQMHQAALALEDWRIIELIKQIPPTHDTLANILTDKVDNLRLDLIANLTQMVLS